MPVRAAREPLVHCLGAGPIAFGLAGKHVFSIKTTMPPEHSVRDIVLLDQLDQLLQRHYEHVHRLLHGLYLLDRNKRNAHRRYEHGAAIPEKDLALPAYGRFQQLSWSWDQARAASSRRPFRMTALK